MLVHFPLSGTKAAVVVIGAVAPLVAQVVAPSYEYTFVPPAPAGATPRILKVELNSDRLQAGGPIAIRVSTTSDVISVTTGHGKRSGMLTLTAPGVFSSESTLPKIGLLGSVHIKLHFEAKTAAGKSASVDVPVSYK